MDGKRHIVDMLAAKNQCTPYMVFEAAALALCKHQHKTIAHLWWVRFEQAKRNLKPNNLLLDVQPEVINWCLGVMFPPQERKESEFLKGGLEAVG